TYQDAGLSLMNLLQDAGHRMATARTVAIDTQNRKAGQQLLQRLFGALGALAEGPQLAAGTARAVRRDRFAVFAVVAQQRARLPVYGQAGVAMVTLSHPAAVVAQQRRRKTSPVEKHQHLIAVAQLL